MTRCTTTRSFCATCFSDGADSVGTVHRLAARRARSCQTPPLRVKGDGRRKAQSYGSASVARRGGRLSARQSRTSCQHRAPLFVAGQSRSISYLLAGPRSGSGGSPAAARERQPARRRRTSTRLCSPRQATFKWTRCLQCKCALKRGDKRRASSCRPGLSRPSNAGFPRTGNPMSDRSIACPEQVRA